MRLCRAVLFLLAIAVAVAAQTVTHQIPTADGLSGSLVVNHVANRIYSGTCRLVAIDGASNQLAGSVTAANCESGARQLAVDPARNRLYLLTGNRLTTIDTTTLTEVGSVIVPADFSVVDLAIRPTNGDVLIATRRLSSGSLAVQRLLPDGGLQSLATGNKGTIKLTTSRMTGRFYAATTDGLMIEHDYLAGSFGAVSLAVNAANERLYIMRTVAGQAEILAYDGHSRALLSSVRLPLNGPRQFDGLLAVDESADRVFAVLPDKSFYVLRSAKYVLQAASLGAVPYALAFNPATNLLYAAVEGDSRLQVASISGVATKVTPVIMWPNPAAITYGTALGSSTLNAQAQSIAGPLTGALTYTPAAGTVLNAGAHPLSVSFAPADAEAVLPANATQSLTVNKAQAVITLSNLTHTYDGQPKAASANVQPGAAAVTLTYDGSTTAPTNAGVYAALAVLNNQNYEGQASGTLRINKADQTIAFAAISDKLATDAPFGLSVSASSGLAASLTASGPISLSGNTVTITGSGAASITASQGGDSNWNAAPAVTRSFTVAALNPVPVLNSTSPNKVIAGSLGGFIVVNGSGFVGGSVVRWNGADLPTTFVGPAELRAEIRPELIAEPSTAVITVFNPTPGGGVSAGLNFPVEDIAIVIQRLTPLAVIASQVQNAHSLTIMGKNLPRRAEVEFTPQGRPMVKLRARYLNRSRLVTIIPKDVLVPGDAVVQVVSVGGGKRSNAQILPIR